MGEKFIFTVSQAKIILLFGSVHLASKSQMLILVLWVHLVARLLVRRLGWGTFWLPLARVGCIRQDLASLAIQHNRGPLALRMNLCGCAYHLVLLSSPRLQSNGGGP